MSDRVFFHTQKLGQMAENINVLSAADMYQSHLLVHPIKNGAKINPQAARQDGERMTRAIPENAATNRGTSFGSPGYRSYVLFSLTLIYTLNFVDRILVSVVGRPIIDEFGLTNLQFGLLTGFGFALFYTFLGIPIARLSEHVNRVYLIAACVILWSLATVMCGFATGFATLLLARMAVGIGEAGCTPPASSIISDYFRPSARPVALSIYGMGVLLGGLLAQLAGGLLLTAFSWREAFLYVGAPGILLGLLVIATVKEPPRGFSEPPRAAPRPARATLRAAFNDIVTKPTFWLVAAGAAMATFGGYGLTSFKPLYIQYAFGVSPGETAVRYMAPIALAGAIGMPVAGMLIQRYSRLSEKAAFVVPAAGFLLSAPLLAIGFLAGSPHTMLASFLAAGLFQYFYVGASYSITQSVVDVRVRATAIAIFLFLTNLLGYGAGPPFVGALADAFAANRIDSLGLGGILNANCSLTDMSVAEDLRVTCQDIKAYGTRWASVVGAAIFILASVPFLIATRFYAADKKR